MATARQTRAMTPEQINEIVGMMKSVDSVELKLTVPGGDQSGLRTALGIDPLDAEMRQVFFFDTPDLRLNQAGVVVRARRIQGGGGDSVIKLRPIDPNHVSKDLRKSPDFSIEIDAMKGGYVCSGSFKRPLDSASVLAGGIGERPVRKLFSREQRAFYEEHAPDNLSLDDLSVLGPIFVLKVKFEPKVLKRRLVAEMWLYPDGSRLVELSTKSDPESALNAAVETRSYLSKIGCEASGEQETKTKKALAYYSARLQDQPAG